MTYCLCILSKEEINWEKINEAIIKEWSFSGLKFIKKLVRRLTSGKDTVGFDFSESKLVDHF